MALERLTADIAANLNGHREAAVEEVKDSNDAKDNGSVSSNARIGAFRLALGRYISGEDVDVVKLYDEVEVILSLAFGETLANERHSRMVEVLRCVEGEWLSRRLIKRVNVILIVWKRFAPSEDVRYADTAHG